MGILYIVATPIGNLQDITFRAIDVLKSVDYIACEDTRHTGSLLKHLGIEKKHFLISYYEESELQRIPNILNVLVNGQNVALVSDAGTPTISDPGFKLIRECLAHGIRVESIPGPSSAISALVSSGLPTDKFFFVGYLPHKPGKRIKQLQDLDSMIRIIRTTIILFEAPHKLLRTLEEMMSVFGDIELVLARELTKVHEEVRRNLISRHIEHFKKTNPKGEFVILFNRGEVYHDRA